MSSIGFCLFGLTVISSLRVSRFMMAGFFRYNDMVFEQFAVELFYHHFTPQKRVYSYEPPFMDFRNAYIAEEFAAEIEEKESRSAFKRFLRKAGIRRG